MTRNPERATDYSAQVIFAETLTDYRADDWTPWVNSANEKRDLMCNMVLNKALRESGGLLPGTKRTVWVLLVEPGTPLHENGKPMTCYSFKCVVSND